MTKIHPIEIEPDLSREAKTPKPRRRIAAIAYGRWASYAAAGVATAVGSTPSSEAEIVYSGPINQTFNDPTAGDGPMQGYFQLDRPGNSLNPAHNRLANGNNLAAFFVYGNSNGIVGFRASPPGSPGLFFPYVSKLPYGQLISTRPFLAPGAMYPGVGGTLALGNGAASGYPNAQWQSPGVGFVGFKFNNGDGNRYGWARLDMSGAPNNTFTFVDFAYGNVGDTIFAGQVPEPGSLALLALGGAGLLVWHKRRAAASAI